MWALGLGTVGFVFFGALSDRIGRKGIMLVGMLLAVVSYRTIYEKIYQTTNLKNKTEIVEKTSISTKGDFVKGSSTDSLYTTTTLKEFTDGTRYKEVQKITVLADKTAEAPKPDIKKSTTINNGDYWALVFWVLVQVLYVTMVYGPIAAFLVELFPTRIRYTSMSLPYHIGNGVFGGLVPFIATALVNTATKADISQPYLNGLWYPIIIASVSLVIGVVYLAPAIRQNAVKKILGIVCMGLGLIVAYFLLTNYWSKIGDNSTEENIKAIVFVFVLTPIITGSLVRFGIYALQGEYDEK
jgi:MHS family proline/betaine transporter-like MFS transporter